MTEPHERDGRRQMNINLDDLEAAAKAATPGPWYHQPYGGQNQNGDYLGGDIFDADGEYLLSEVSDAVGAHIATFDPPTVLALIARLWEAETARQVEHQEKNRARNERNATQAKLREAEAVIERARGWAEKPIPGFTVEDRMAEVADALAPYRLVQSAPIQYAETQTVLELASQIASQNQELLNRLSSK